MSSIRKLAFVFASSLILSIGMTPAHAVNLTWDNDTDGSDGSNTDFNNPFNWGPGQTGTVPGAADNANFGGAAVSNPNVTAADTIQGLTFLLGSSGYTLSSSGPSLTLTNTGTTTTSAINALNASGTNTISGPIILGGNASTTATFTQAAGGTLVVSGNISSTNLITGLSLSSSANTGIFTLSGTNSYNGSTTLGAATLNLNSNSALGSSNLIIGSGSAVINNTSGSAKTLANNISFNNTLTFTGSNDLTFGQLILAGGAARNLVANAGRLTFTNGASFATGRFQKTGAGTVVLNAAGSGSGIAVNVGASAVSYTETQRLDAGFVEIGNSSAFSSGVVEFRTGGGLTANTPVTVNNTIMLSTGSAVWGGSNNITFGGNVVVSNGASSTGTNGVFTVNVTNTAATQVNGSISLTDHPIAASNNTLVLDVASTAGATEIAGIIQDHTAGSFASSVGSLRKTNAGTLKLSGNNTYSGTTDIQNGTVQLTGALSPSSSLSLGSLTNSGKLILGSSAAALNQTVARLNSAGTGSANSVVGGNASVSTLTVNNTTADTFAGVLGGAGTNENKIALTKSGTGSLTLSGINTSTGPTTINGGKLAVTGSLNSSPITVSGGTLDGTGSVGATTVANDLSSIVANGNGAASALTLSSLGFGGAGTASVKVGQATPTIAGLAVTGVLSTTPANGTVMINAATDTGLWNNGSIYNLLSYGSFGSSLSNFALGTVSGLNSRQLSGLVQNGNNIALQISGDSPKWTGLDNGNWQIGATGANKNWKLITAGTATDYIDGDSVLFDDSAVGTTSADINAGNVSPTAVTFNNSTKNYTISGSGGGISGSGFVLKNGTGSATISASLSYSGATTLNSGTLTLSGSNSNTGGTIFNGGTLNVESTSALGNGTLTIAAGSGKALNNTSGAPIALTGVTSQTWNDDFTFTGANDLDMGTGAVTLNGASRSITVSGSRLTVGGLQGGTTTALAVSGAGVLAIGNSTVAGLSGGGTIENNVAGGATLTLNQNSDGTFNGTLQNGISSTLNLTKQGTASLTLTGNNTYSGTTTINTGAIVAKNAQALGTGNIQFSATSTGTLDIALDPGSELTNPTFGTNSGSNITILSDRATPGAGTSHTLGSSVLGGGTINIGKGSNVTSGSASIALGAISMTSGSAQTTTFNPTTADATLASVASSTNNFTRTLELGGTSTGNVVLGDISQSVASALSLLKSGTSTWTLAGNSTYTGTTTISGGTLVVGSGGASGSLGTGAVTNNGTLSYNRSDTFTETHAIGGTGGLRQIGTGRTVLSAANGYTGPTVITGGALAVTGSINSSSVNVTSGTLDGTGSVGVTTVTDLVSNTIANGNGGFGTLSLSSLAFGGDATVSATKSIGVTPFAVTGALATTPANGQVTITGAGTWSSGLNNIISFGSFGGSISNFSVGSITGLSPRQSVGGLSLNGNNIALNIIGNVLIWTGKDDANWAVGLTGVNKNWKLTTGGAATDYLEGDEVKFDDTATGPTTIDLGTNVGPTSATFNNTTKNYTITGFNGIVAGSLTKSGTGSLTLNTFNSYASGTTFNGGTLNLGTSSALGTGPLTIGTGNAKTLDNTSGGAMFFNSTIAQNWNDDFIFTGSNDLDMQTGDVIVGGTGNRTVTVSANTLSVGELRAPSNDFIKQGAGTLVLDSVGVSGASDGSIVAGKLTVAAGTLQINRTGVTGNASGDLTVGDLAGTGTITNGAGSTRALFVNNTGSSTFGGTLADGSGGAPLDVFKQGTGTLILAGASTYTGNTQIQGGTVVMANGQALGAVTASNTIRFSNAAPANFATLDLATNGVSDNIYRMMVGSSSIVNIVSNRATPGAGISHALTTGADSLTDTVGNATINFTAGSNVTSGTANVSFDQFNLSAGAAGTTVLNPTTATVTIGTVTKNRNAPAQTLELSGTNTGNQITGSISNGSATISLAKSGTGTWTISGDSSYSGGTAVSGGTLLVNNTTGSGTGTGAVTVNNGGTLGGTGIIDTSSTSSNVAVSAGGSLAPGASAGTLTMNLGAGTLDVSAANAGGLKFELTAPGSGDQVVLSAGTLNVGTLDFSDFTFTNLGGVAVGTYKLFDANSAITGSIGAASGSFGGFAATLSVDNLNNDVLLNVTGTASLQGDYNNNGKVDAADYVLWRKNPGAFGGNPAGYTTWRNNFGTPGSGSSLGGAAVPEPGTCLLTCFAAAMILATRRARSARLTAT